MNGWSILEMYDQKTTLLDKDNQLLLPFTLNNIYPLSKTGGVIGYRINRDLSGLLDQNGDLIFGGNYENVNRITPNNYLVRLNKKWGMVDAENKIIIPLEYSKFYLMDGLIRLTKGSKQTYFDYMGKKVR